MNYEHEQVRRTMDREVVLIYGYELMEEETGIAYVSEFLSEQDSNDWLRDRLFDKVREAIGEIDSDGSAAGGTITIEIR